MIWAEDLRHGIGKQQSIPWHIPGDMAFFKKTTSGNTVVMGRKTFDSIGKALPNRKNIVLSHHPTSLPNSVVGVGSLSELQVIFETHPNEKFYIIGGSHLYNALLSQADELLITRIQKDYQCEVFAPDITQNEFKLASSVEHESIERNPAYTFETWIRI
ncbi:dihydrofolate reductase [Pediococcus pentosaceus]|uniref:dihydrofolate reductase n=1 Tax=Pediococcus pentosaceus TaxID=1255 RepID=UPI0018F5D8AC|nr:dihydrofolate reductase [Pediococcus pentosaceus]